MALMLVLIYLDHKLGINKQFAPEEFFIHQIYHAKSLTLLIYWININLVTNNVGLMISVINLEWIVLYILIFFNAIPGSELVKVY